MSNVTLTDLLMAAAILIAPILAVQVQKWLEIFREQRGRKLWIFKTLMATRAANLSSEHVQALNMIDLEFRGKKYKAVTNSWKAYLDHLASFPKDDEQLQVQWNERLVDRLTNLLMEMGKSLGYEFDEVHVKKGVYAPEAHGRLENENALVRRGLIRVLYGDAALKMDVESFPVSEDEAKEQEAIRKALISVLQGSQALQVKTSETDGEESNV
ncbi:MAG: DUF6680 family protein [Saccharospirillum sp.]|uniref:DUF6680 family protein n=1 Tax=Saccharospirillum sp. TaxID=2033801 RepID=UPI0034A04859